MLAIDHGSKKFGFAVCDGLRIAVQPLEPLRGDEAQVWTRIQELLEERDVDTVVVGVPFERDGGEGPRAREVRAFMQRFAARFPKLQILAQDERLSSKAADELAREMGLHGKALRAVRDSLAAVVILRDWLAAGEPR